MSEIKVNKISPRTACGTVTLGDSGDTIALGSGASQTGFGRTGTVNWQTTPKTGDFTAANGEGYFINTTSGEVEMTMPSGSAGSIVSIQDYNKTFDDNTFTVTPASGQKINGGSADGSLLITTEGQGLTFVYVDSTVGWKTVHENEFTSGGSTFIVATGGTETTSGNCKIHTFTGPGTFTVCQAAQCAANNVVSYLVVAGGGAGGAPDGGGGGGAGGYREVKSPVTPFTASPLDGYPSAPNRITVTATSFPITVGAGGAPQCGNKGANGSPSIFSSITSAGGGGGMQFNTPPSSGGSGGGGGGRAGSCGSSGGSGNTPPTTPAQGTNGGPSTPGTSPGSIDSGGGGGGATASGATGAPNGPGGVGGAGGTSSINGTPTARAGGGGGGSESGSAGAGGAGGGGAGKGGTGSGTAGTDNTGGGGGGAGTGGGASNQSGAGGSGIVIIRYKFQ